jgi:hypothetical protein
MAGWVLTTPRAGLDHEHLLRRLPMSENNSSVPSDRLTTLLANRQDPEYWRHLGALVALVAQYQQMQQDAADMRRYAADECHMAVMAGWARLAELDAAGIRQQIDRHAAELELLDLLHAQEPDWSRPESVKTWARVYSIGRNTMPRRFKKQQPRNKQSGRDYMVALDDLPAGERDKFRARRAK